MIVGCYTLHLYCEVVKCSKHWWSESLGINQPQTRQEAEIAARALGWGIYRSGMVYCPEHQKEAKK